MKVQIVLFEGFDLLDVTAPYEVFTAAAMYTEQELDVELVSTDGKGMVTSGINGVQLQASSKLDINKAGIILIPGASGSIHAQGLDSIPAKLQQAADTELSAYLTKAIKNPDILLCTVCGGSLVLAMSGLLEGRHAVTHHMGMGLLPATEAIPIQARVVDDGDLITGGGVTSGLDVALYVVERELGPRIANAVEQLFEYERRGTVWKAVGSNPIETQQSETKKPSDDNFSPASDNVYLFEGKWDTTISTPIGKLNVQFNFLNREGKLLGTANHDGETVDLNQLVQKGNHLTWSMKVTKPIRLTLKFNVHIENNELFGEAKAGMLPSSKLTGHRIS